MCVGRVSTCLYWSVPSTAVFRDISPVYGLEAQLLSQFLSSGVVDTCFVFATFVVAVVFMKTCLLVGRVHWPALPFYESRPLYHVGILISAVEEKYIPSEQYKNWTYWWNLAAAYILLGAELGYTCCTKSVSLPSKSKGLRDT